MRIRSLIATLVLASFVLAGCAVGGTKTVTTTRTTTRTVTQTVTTPAPPPAAEAETANVKYFGIPVSLTKIDQQCGGDQATPAFSCYALTIKPEFFLVGVTANVAFAAGQQNSCQPLQCPPVEDDRWVIGGGSENLVFILPATTKGTVLDDQQKNSTVTAAQLAPLVARKKLDSGVWVTVDVDTVTTFAQQYQP